MTCDGEILPSMVNTSSVWAMDAELGKNAKYFINYFWAARWWMIWDVEGPVCSIFPPLFNLIRSEFKAEWVSKILPWSRFQIVFWRAVMMQVRAGRPGWVCTLLLLQRESPKYQLTHIQETVALNWMRHWACNIGMCLSEVDWEETREVSPQCC